MDIPGSIPEMANALAEFERAHWNSLPEPVQQVIDSNRGGSMVDLFANAAEALYAHRADLSNQASRQLLAQLATFCGANGWHGFGDGRGFAVADAMRRELGEEPPAGAEWRAPEDDPPASPDFAPAPASEGEA